MQNIKAKDFMDPAPLAIEPDTGVIRALRKLLSAKVSGAPVVDQEQHLVGFISEADCMRGTLMGSYYTSVGELVRDRMTTEVESIGPEANIVDIAETFLKNHRSILPVVKEGKVIGLIERHALLEQLMEHIDHNENLVA
ncbi:CBS domain-containing protein [Oceanospirillum beijerinckii]|uniref:CBS domain-containing protein n=1 Tax=Oceanospirillum beijerinckii TaxID=64976 RepID=UPI00041FAE86|nr:CBS domain-containing protein [Oceanospirillum beijerinckii]MAC47861.1 CBS domain-containing protein [Oceanospirillum sp.]